MTPASLPTPPRTKSPTQPLGWDWVADWIDLDARLRDLEARHGRPADAGR